MTPRPVAVFGGSFNPIHLGHLAVAEEARCRRGWDRVIFVPAACSPFKTGDEIPEGRHRLEMVRLATASNPAFAVSDFEVARGGTSYSVETLRHFRKTLGAEVPLVFLLGTDAAETLPRWRSVEEIFGLCRFLVVSRPGYDGRRILETLPEAWRSRVDFEDALLFDVSSSLIRGRLREGGSVRHLLPEVVGDYIRRNRLYA